MRSDNANFIAKNTQASKEPRYTVEITFDDTTSPRDLEYFTSHSDAEYPTGANVIQDVITSSGITGTTQKINPDRGIASIGNITIKLVDKAEAISTIVNTKLDIGLGLRGKRVKVYTSFKDEVWADYVLIATQTIDSISFSNGTYIINCVDIQRSERKQIFDVASTTMSAGITDSDLLIPVYSVTGFEALEHGTSYSDQPSDYSSSPQVIKEFIYLKIEDEIIRCTGVSLLNFVVDVDLTVSPNTNGRGALNTKAAAHEVDTTLSNDRKTKVTEYIYLELPIVKLIYAILTGVLNGQTGKTLPSKWHLAISPEFVKLSDFTGIGLDWYDSSDDTLGVIGYFEGIKKQDAKKFIETQLNLLLGSYNPVYASGELGLKRMTNILAGAGYIAELNETNVTGYGELKHDMRSVLNSFQIDWNWNETGKEYTRSTLLIDSTSISQHNESTLKKLEFRGLNGTRHTEQVLFNQFNSLRDRYAGPPLKLKVNCLPSLNVLEVGDIVRVNLPNIRDYNGSLSPLDRSFEVQGVSTNWITGQVSFDLFGSSQSAGALALGASATVLNDAFYVTNGTELQAYLNSLGSPSAFEVIGGIGHIRTSVTLAGSNPATIYYYDGPLTIDNGATVTITNNVDIRCKGHLTINGIIDGAGQGPAAVAGVPTYFEGSQAAGTAGGLGITKAWGGQHIHDHRYLAGGNDIGNPFMHFFTSAQAVGTTSGSLPQLTLINDTDNDTLKTVPTNLMGSSGGAGGNLTYQRRDTGASGVLAIGGAGGAGGAGLITISRGVTFGGSGSVDLSGDNGTKGTTGSYSGLTHYSGTGAGGSSGGWYILIDGETQTLPDTNKITTNHGTSEASTTNRWPNSGEFQENIVNPSPKGLYDPFYEGYQGIVDQDYFKIQFIEPTVSPTIDAPVLTVIPPTLLVLNSGDNDLLKALDGTIISRIHVQWTASIDQNIGGYEVEYKRTTDSIYIPASNTINLEIVQTYISPVQDGINYDIRVRAINNIGVRSDWLTLTSYTVIGKLDPPADCDQFTVQRLSDGTRVFDGGYVPSSNAPTDFAGYEIRAALGTGLAWSALTPLHTGLITQLPFETNQLAAGSYTAGIKAVDTTGIYSTNAVLVDSTLGDPRIKFALVTVDFHADGFPDTKTNCWVDPVAGNLIATDQYTWANFATGSPIQTWADWLTWATNPNSPITYETAAIDIGAILNVTPLVTITSNGTTVTLQESHSDDNISYTSYATSGSLISCRYIKIKITVINATATPLVTAAQLIVDSEVIEEYIEDLDTSTVDLGSPRVAGDIRLPVVETYSTIKNVQVALQNVGAGWSWELIDKTITGPRIKIYNSSNVLSDATIDAFISGA